MEAKLSETKAVSDLCNAAASSHACALYSACMQRSVRGGAVNAARLRSEHERAAAAARQELADRRSRASDHPDSDDHFLDGILRVSIQAS